MVHNIHAILTACFTTYLAHAIRLQLHLFLSVTFPARFIVQKFRMDYQKWGSSSSIWLFMIQSARLHHQMKLERGHHRLPCCLRHHYCLQKEMINCTKFELVAVSNVAYSVFLYRYSDAYRYYTGSHDRLIICGSCMLDFLLFFYWLGFPMQLFYLFH